MTSGVSHQLKRAVFNLNNNQGSVLKRLRPVIFFYTGMEQMFGACFRSHAIMSSFDVFAIKGILDVLHYFVL